MKFNGKTIFFSVLIFSIIMVNPPVVFWVNDYCVTHPLTFGWPTLYLWLEFWFVVMIVDFIVAALKLKAWNCSQDAKEIEQVSRPEF